MRSSWSAQRAKCFSIFLLRIAGRLDRCSRAFACVMYLSKTPPNVIDVNLMSTIVVDTFLHCTRTRDVVTDT